MKEARVQSLVKELRSYKPRDAVNREREEEMQVMQFVLEMPESTKTNEQNNKKNSQENKKTSYMEASTQRLLLRD